MACRRYAPYVLASVAVLLASALIIFGICMHRSLDPTNILKVEKNSDSAQNFESFFSDELEAVLPNDDMLDSTTNVQFLIGTTATTAATTESAASGSSHNPSRMELEHSTTTTEVCFQSFFVTLLNCKIFMQFALSVCCCCCCCNFLHCISWRSAGLQLFCIYINISSVA